MIAYDRYHLSRCDALEFLTNNFDEFPSVMPSCVVEIADGISESVFRGWRFVVIDTGELVFADCLSPCIRASDFSNLFSYAGG